MDVSLPALALLVVASFVAGTVDAIAGGGGLVTLPALLAAGLPPALALGTNKGQSVFGSGAALLRYARAGLVDGRVARVTFPAGLLGSLGGPALVLLVPPAMLRPVVLALLVVVAAVLTFRPAAPRNGVSGLHRQSPRNRLSAGFSIRLIFLSNHACFVNAPILKIKSVPVLTDVLGFNTSSKEICSLKRL